ncbi:S8 family peptidase [Paenibacillus pasadenensis]|uniref:S8 family peptidase n=1 Tax=Paenibacillus pasadenensis TaxID=217090 RepID=UPI00203BE480|nr:S8 family peptidase [Paenibacillus pasadenensis]MCM3749555.1 S8 family peptidase [Paenibacillus pasadenensis]
MDQLLRWLRHLPACAGAPARRLMLCFRHRDDYYSVLHSCKEISFPREMLTPLPLVQSISLLLPAKAALPQLPDSVTLEHDSLIHMNAAGLPKAMPEKGLPWGVQQIRAPLAWNRTTGHRVKIGVIDTGVDHSHPDLKSSLGRGINLIDRTQPPHDDNGHGTHIAGTIAAANQPSGMIGVAPRSIVYPVKAFDQHGSAYVSDIILGIEWCVRSGMNIINMSFGMRSRSKALHTACINATNAGVIIIASSGNDSRRRSVDYPARYPQTISVGATNRLRRIAAFSNRGPYIDIYAPGDRIHSAWLKGKYHEMSGTSMATSHVSGAVALLLAQKPELTPSDIKAILKRSMIPLRGAKDSKAPGELDVPKMMKAAEL